MGKDIQNTRPPEPRAVLTARQTEILEWVKRFMEEHGVPPTVREIGGAFGIKSSSVFDLLQALERKGHLVRRREMGVRSLMLKSQGGGRRLREMVPVVGEGSVLVPILGRVAAGQPILAEENVVGEVAVGPGMGRGRYFALEVRGDSMVDAGIPDGGLVIVRQQPVAENGDVVVVILGDEATVKRLSIREERIELLPENEMYDPIPVGPDSDLRIVGKVIAVRPGGET